MRHQKSGRKLGQTSSHRLAMFRNMAESLVQHGRIETTLMRAKELRPIADRLVTLGKKNDIPARRRAFNYMRSETTVKKLFDELAPLFKDRHGGYTRISRLGSRLGDAASMAILEYVDFPKLAEEAPKPSKAKKKEKAQK